MSDSSNDLPAGVPPEQQANLSYVRQQLQAGPRTRGFRGGLRFAERETAFTAPAAAMRDADISQSGARTFRVATGKLMFRAAASESRQADREWQSIGTVSTAMLMKRLGEPEWVDMLCLARNGHKYSVLPVMLEDAADEADEGADETTRLVLHREPGIPCTAQALSDAFMREDGVMGACTEAGPGVFVAFVFNLE